VADRPSSKAALANRIKAFELQKSVGDYLPGLKNYIKFGVNFSNISNFTFMMHLYKCSYDKLF